MSQAVFTLTGRAARWIHLLRDFGHLDQERLEELYLRAADLAAEVGHPPHLPVDVDLVRRAAAMLLHQSDDAMSPVLEEDWPLLFS